jgi:hypothetical protein
MKKAIIWGLFMIMTLTLQAQTVSDELVIDYMKETLEHSLSQKDEMIENWKLQYEETAGLENALELLGYRPPDFLVSIAALSAFLYQETGEIEYAQTTRDLLVSLQDYRQYFPQRFRDRVEYEQGVPVVNWFRTLPRFTECYERTKVSGVYSEKDIDILAESAAASVNIIFAFPEWGAMNRALLRAESFMAAAVTFPDHPDAGKWRKMAEILAHDSLESWEIEDAQIYHPVWLRPYVNYLDLSDQTHLFQSPIMKFYFDYFVSLVTPNRTIPEFGDGHWRVNLYEYYVLLERGAKEYQSGEMKWAAQEMWKNLLGESKYSQFMPDNDGSRWDRPDLGFANMLVMRQDYIDETVEPMVPHYGSGDALEELYSKKIVFRSDWSEDASYLMLNYRDEGYYSIMQKNYLKHILAVEEEKMHHGHSDENAICLFMKKGTVLLDDGNYREKAPSGEFGAFRADIFHNRIAVRAEKKSLNQPYFDILRNSGAYNDQVRTTKIDFQSFREVEYSRTRLEDMFLHYRWDRTLVRHKKSDLIVIVDALKFFRSNYFTVANLLHTRKIVEKGDNWFVVRLDTLSGRFANPGDLNLLVIFPQEKFTGTETERRDLQKELVLFQGTSQYYDAGKTESFVTLLYPIEPGADAQKVVDSIHLLRSDMDAVAVQVDGDDRTDVYGIKLDLDRDLVKADIRPRYNYESGRLVYGEAETDADFFFLSVKEDKPYYSATNLVKFIYNNKVLFDTPESQFFQVWGKSDLKGRAKWRRWDNYPSN